ncbi:hypothetical protein [Pseudalkalibacillus sp. NRS-1564]|uniref:hypothetical protein n=1 Tax=Pseudalkalibacillus sp. NRS-1564 TaxID=3233900 RepID=UPI003D2AF2A1
MLFVLFTMLNFFAFTKDLATSLYLTLIFFDLFIRMPFIAINIMYAEKKKFLSKMKKKGELSPEAFEKFEYIFQKKSRLLFALYKTGYFSYGDLMESIYEGYSKKPFKVSFNVLHMNRKRLETKYMNDIKKEGITA